MSLKYVGSAAASVTVLQRINPEPAEIHRLIERSTTCYVNTIVDLLAVKPSASRQLLMAKYNAHANDTGAVSIPAENISYGSTKVQSIP